jgi:membrane protease YdiL (CAAX protease family)
VGKISRTTRPTLAAGAGAAVLARLLIEILKPKFGLNAILIASAMYGIAHYTKPLPEQLGAFLVGIVLGYIGDRYRTFYFGVIIHYLISLSMDAFLVVPALLRK